MPITVEVDFGSISTLTEAVERCLALAGFKVNKVTAHALGIDYSSFQRMMKEGDQRHFPADLVLKAMELAGNDLPLEWLARRRGKAVYSFEQMEVIDRIREALVNEGKSPKFALKDEG